jgi:hypothetical protein
MLVLGLLLLPCVLVALGPIAGTAGACRAAMRVVNEAPHAEVHLRQWLAQQAAWGLLCGLCSRVLDRCPAPSVTRQSQGTQS